MPALLFPCPFYCVLRSWHPQTTEPVYPVVVTVQLKGVLQIQAADRAFAAILEDGCVVTWGDGRFGGDSSAVQDQLKGVQKVQATGTAFAAILEDWSVVTWVDAADGGDSSAVPDPLRSVVV